MRLSCSDISFGARFCEISDFIKVSNYAKKIGKQKEFNEVVRNLERMLQGDEINLVTGNLSPSQSYSILFTTQHPEYVSYKQDAKSNNFLHLALAHILELNVKASQTFVKLFNK